MAYAAHQSLTNSHPAPHGSFAGIVAVIERVYGHWQDRRAEQHALESMDERDLRDAGLSRWAVERELARPVWHG